MNERLKFAEYKGKKILIEDFSGIDDENQFIELMNEAAMIVQSQEPKSCRVLVDLTNAHFNARISQASKEVAGMNTPFIKASATVGITGLMKVIVKAINSFTKRELKIFKTREEAMEWLTAQ